MKWNLNGMQANVHNCMVNPSSFTSAWKSCYVEFIIMDGTETTIKLKHIAF